ncbi:uncharacterized protein V1516DRAFT_673014 [Lipomyces oligophaga]|uniref:uncharacterized protein n=1 Tax=Lipomyces oligophaga TaxID=45792 RepID=UPI0034CD0B50
MLLTKLKTSQFNDLKLLSSTFVFVKIVLFVIPQLVLQQYDTSSQLLFKSSAVPELVNYILPRFLVWDTVFFIKIAQRGYLYEQEWAFGWLWTGLIRVVGDYCVNPSLYLIWPGLKTNPELDDLGNQVESVYGYAIASLIIAHVCHYLAILVLYFVSTILEQHLFKRPDPESTGISFKPPVRSFPLIVGLLYIVSPGGIFLSAGYSETAFALFSFLGIYFRETNQPILSGAAFTVTCGLRGNGILWGIIFLNDLYESFNVKAWGRCVRIVIGGSLIGAGFLSGQVFAYLRYCPGREWCGNVPPLIYGYVQNHYWGVGLFKYWRTWQIPNFFFAFPTWFLFWRSYQRYSKVPQLRPYIIIQSLMFVMSIFIWHVQIITRVGTCMPAVYWYIAERIYIDEPATKPNTVPGRGIKKFINRARQSFKMHEGLWEVKYMITWIAVQAVLFASFIPPA